MKQARARPRGYITFSSSTHLRLKFILLINVKMPTLGDILTFICRINDWQFFFYFNLKISLILALSVFMSSLISCSNELSMKKSSITSGSDFRH